MNDHFSLKHSMHTLAGSISSNIGQTISPANIKQPVFSALDEADNAISFLESEWMELMNRLSPVYRQELQNEKVAEAGAPYAISCELESRVKSQAQRINRITEAMGAIRAKLCI